MENLVTIEEAFKLPNPQFIDLRSPVEFAEAHIPGAVNLPLLDDDERSIVGTIYKEQSPDLAVEKGFALVAPKLPHIHLKIKEIGSKKTAILYCWRGGMRSQAVSQLLNTLRTPHYRLLGGYKSFRRYVNEFFQQPFKQEIIVLHGLTGVGKTEILQRMRKEGMPAIDLEELANNRGSVFGQVGLTPVPTQKQFEGELFWECHKFRDFPAIVVECESRRIGSLVIPVNFFAAMQRGRRVLVYDSLPNRISRLVATYTQNHSRQNEEELRAAINNLRKRLGHQKVDRLLSLLAEQDYRQVVEQLLEDYYDPLYHYPAGPSPDYELNLAASDMEDTIASLKKMLSTHSVEKKERGE